MDIRVPLPSVVQRYVKSDETLWARLVSFLISPPIVWAVWVYPIALTVADSTLEAMVHATIFGTFVCWIPIAFVAYRVRIGKIGDLHMRESHERYIPYSISIIGGIVTGFILAQLGAHPTLLILTLISSVQLTLMLAGTFFSHISTHAMAIASVTSATALVFGIEMSLVFVPLILLVVLARLVLHRHTVTQIMTGTLIGTLTPFLVIALLTWMIDI